MSRWRGRAIEAVPHLRAKIAECENIMQVWMVLREALEAAYEPPRDESTIARIHAHARWCLTAPRAESADMDPLTAVCHCFYEHIPQHPSAAADLHRWMSADEVDGMRPVFEYMVGKAAIDQLVAKMRASTRRR